MRYGLFRPKYNGMWGSITPPPSTNGASVWRLLGKDRKGNIGPSKCLGFLEFFLQIFNILPHLNSLDLQMRYDERSLFPKYILDMEAKMKATHALGLRVSRGARARGDSQQTKSRGSHDTPQGNSKKLAAWRVLLTSKGKDM